MRRCLAAATVAATFFLAGGCTDPAGTEPPARGSRNTPSADRSGRQATTALPELDVPENARVLVAETVGTGSADLPGFTPSEEAYTVYADCSGRGQVALVDRDGEGQARPIACDGAGTVGVIHTDRKPQHLAIRVTGGAADWKISVVPGDHHR